jgi:signal transduction histidine kinase
VGGVIMGGYEQGLHAAERLDEILKGNIDSISFLAKTPEQILFDYPQLIKYGLNPNLLPKETEFINRPVTFLERYQTELTISLAILGFLLAVILVLLRIISLKNNAEKQLLKSESRLGLAMEGAMLGLWDLDFIKKDVYLSSQIYDLLGFKNHSDFNYSFNNWSELVHFEDLFQLIEVFQMHSRHIVPSFKGEVRLKTFEGKYKWFSMHGRITEYDNGKPSRMIGIITNINFQKEFEEQLKLAKEKAEESDRLKSSFLANMSHEIRTPMNAILGFTDLIINGDIENDEIKDYLKHIRNSGESLLNLINDIIDFSKIQSGQLALRNETFDLNALCDNVAIVASTIIKQKQKNITITTKKGSPEESFLIVADPFRLEQVLYNLVSNSIKFTQSGDIVISYQIVNAKTISFSVKDTGQGVAPEHHDLIFERFRQVENSPTNNTGGTGLGLAITKSLLTLMGGCISIKSNLNKGATFTFTINYKPISLISGIHF